MNQRQTCCHCGTRIKAVSLCNNHYSRHFITEYKRHIEPCFTDPPVCSITLKREQQVAQQSSSRTYCSDWTRPMSFTCSKCAKPGRVLSPTHRSYCASLTSCQRRLPVMKTHIWRSYRSFPVASSFPPPTSKALNSGRKFEKWEILTSRSWKSRHLPSWTRSGDTTGTTKVIHT